MVKVRLNILKNGEPSQHARAVVVENKYDELVKAAKNKLRMKKVAKVFKIATSQQIVDSDESMSTLQNDDYVAFEAKEDKSLVISDTHEKIQEKFALEAQKNEDVPIRILANGAWLDDEAISQLETTAKTLKGIVLAVGMPDLHPGKGFPVGTAFATQTQIYPSLIGSDIGCGMSFFELNVSRQNIKMDKWVKSLYGLEERYEGDVQPWLTDYNVQPTVHDQNSLGTIGGGNHFAEVQVVHQIVDQEMFDKLKLNDDKAYLLVHSGSRGYGFEILTNFEDKFGSGVALDEESNDGKSYLQQHDNACNWAKANRALIAQRFMSCLNLKGDCKFDIWHNNVVKKRFLDGNSYWLHRKGAAPADLGPIIIPGSRGSYSYLVAPSENVAQLEFAGYSVAHGAGRRMNRAKALEKRSKITAAQLETTELGSRVICEDTDLLYEEQPAAYKDIDKVVEDLVANNVVTVCAIMKPVITYKTRKQKNK